VETVAESSAAAATNPKAHQKLAFEAQLPVRMLARSEDRGIPDRILAHMVVHEKEHKEKCRATMLEAAAQRLERAADHSNGAGQRTGCPGNGAVEWAVVAHQSRHWAGAIGADGCSSGILVLAMEVSGRKYLRLDHRK